MYDTYAYDLNNNKMYVRQISDNLIVIFIDD